MARDWLGNKKTPTSKFPIRKNADSDVWWLYVKAFLGLLVAIAWIYFVIFGRTI